MKGRRKMKVPGVLHRKAFVGSIAAIVVAAISIALLSGGKTNQLTYSFATVTKATIESTISSSGTLNAVTEITVGTQVSGTIQRVYADFNQKVKKGQIIAVLDSALLQMAVTNAQADLLKAEATFDEAQLSFKRSEQLFQKSMISETDFQTVKTSLKSAEAGLMTARTALQRAMQNLSYAIIRSPIDGTVTERSVEEGQTVAASFSTPTLFTIAQDLAKMEIKATVDESDIGEIKEGQTAKFTVQAYPSKTFEGMVKQVRLKPTTSSNVVNYTVVVSAANDEHLLMPGMTATVEFIIASRAGVLAVPNAALRFQPSQKELTAAMERMKVSMPPPPDSLRNPGPPPPPPQASTEEWKRLWYLDESGQLASAPVHVGITDGSKTEILGGRFAEGMKIISEGETQTALPSSSRSQNNGPPPPMM
jgi:HlyD family secretion protein